MATIYERMDAAELALTQLQTAMTALNVVTLTEGADLHELAVGEYLIPTSAIAASILNKPSAAGNSTSIVRVVSGGSDGQKVIYYVPCSKTNPTYYQQAYYQSAWGEWNTINLIDSGWIDLTLNSGITAYSEDQKPRYRRVGKEVFISGVFKGVTANNTDIATLPAGYRPSKKIIIAVGSVGQMISRLSIDTNGVISYNRSTIEPVIAENYHSIACSFNVD